MINAFAAKTEGAKLEPFEYEPGELGDNEVEIDVQYCGICHSDISIINNDWGMSQYPAVPGHEVVGTIGKVGGKVSNVKEGDKVGLGWHSGFCGDCNFCESGDKNLCGSAQPTIVAHHGGFADKVRAKSDAVVILPEKLDMKSAGPLFCAGITVFNPLVQFDVKPTDRVAVIGIGGLGHLALQFLNAWGCKVTAFTSSEAKRKTALDLGAHDTLDSTDEQALASAAGRFDLIISTVNVKLDWGAYLNTLTAKGRLHFVGATLEPLDIQAFSLIAAQRSVSGSPVGSPATIAQMLEFAALHNISPKIETYKFDQVNEAIDRVKSGKAMYRVVLEK